MDILPLLNELQGIARDGLTFARDPHDRRRYERLLRLASEAYGSALELPPDTARERLAAELGIVTPKVGADAAIFDDEGRILLMRRSDDRLWCLPCGWVELDEAPVAAAVRETKEEAGLDVEAVALVDVFTRFPSERNGPYTTVSVVYLCEIVDGELTLSDEGLDLRYWRLDEVEDWHADHERFARAAHDMWLRGRQTDR